MLVYLLRHGDAIERGYEDAARPLSSLGKAQAKIAAQTLITIGVKLNVILSSPLERAVQTAKIVQKEISLEKVSTTEYLVPGSDHRQLIKQLNGQKVENLLLVGHEPHLSTFISLLINGEKYSRVEIKKGSLASLEISTPIKKGTGTLKWLLTLDLMKQLQ